MLRSLMKMYQCHILLAEDDPDDRKFFEEALEEIPFAVELSTVADGAELIQWLAEKRTAPDFLFLDLNMPKKNGFECLKEIKQYFHLNSFPVIVLSTAANPKDIDALYENGAQYYLRKPACFNRLVELIKKILTLPKNRIYQQPKKQDFVITL